MARKLFRFFVVAVFIINTHVLYADSESKSLTVQGGTNNSSNKLSYTTFVNMYYMAANAATSWTIHSASISPSGSWNIDTTSSRALGGGQTDEEVATAELFGVHIHGYIYKSGGSGGPMPEFDVYGQHSGSLSLEREKDKMIIGDSGVFALKENGSTVSSAYWKCYLQSASAPAWASGGGSIGLPATGTTAPGNYIVEARSDSNNDKDKKTSEFAYIKVNLTVSTGIISAYPLANDGSFPNPVSITNITISTDPSGHENIVQLEVNAGEGTVSKVNATTWSYSAFTELKSDKDPSSKIIKIYAKINSFKVDSTKRIYVLPVFEYFDFIGNRTAAFRYVIWKYPVSIANLNSISYVATQSEMGLTSPLRNCTLGPDAFTSENKCISVIGHENVHGGQATDWIGLQWIIWLGGGKYLVETQAYGWEISNDTTTGIDPGYKSNCQAWYNYYDRTGPKP